MKKIPTIFVRDENNRKYVTKEINPICKWVFNGEGVATRKYDGTCCKIENGRLFKRREIKPGKEYPENFELIQKDENTGKSVGWIPVGDGPDDQYHREAFGVQPAGTYELCGPKVQGNPELYDFHILVSHADAQRYDVDRTYDGLKNFLSHSQIEGLVFHHQDGRMAKIKARDFRY